MLWMFLTLFYGVVKGVREIVKKKSFEKSTLLEVLFFYTLIGFVMVLPFSGNVGGLTPELYGLVALKSFIIFVAWLCGFKAVKEIPISVYGVLDLSRVLFSTLLGVFILHETMTGHKATGILLVAAGLIALRYEKPWRERRDAKRAAAKAGAIVETTETEIVPPDQVHKAENAPEDQAYKSETAQADQFEQIGQKKQTEHFEQTEPESVHPEHVEPKEKGNPILFIIMAFLSALLNAVSGTMDKILTKDVTPAQLQFWYMLFLLLMYGAYILVTRTKLDVKRALKNYWIWILSFLFIIADRALFIANQIGDSQVTVMTLLKQAGCIVTILAGRFVFKEKGIGYKLCCAGVIITGIVIGSIK